jgi:hypothetical protein
MFGRHESARPKFQSRMSSPSATALIHTQRISLWVLFTALIITGVVMHMVWNFTSSLDDAEARVGFEIRASQIDIAVRERMRDYEQALLGMSTIFRFRRIPWIRRAGSPSSICCGSKKTTRAFRHRLRTLGSYTCPTLSYFFGAGPPVSGTKRTARTRRVSVLPSDVDVINSSS